jgi:hypothetical protein
MAVSSARADCIYYKSTSGEFRWRRGALHHGPRHPANDVGPNPTYPRAHALLSDDSRYFGPNGSADYKSRWPLIKGGVEHLGQCHWVYHEESLRLSFKNSSSRCGLKSALQSLRSHGSHERPQEKVYSVFSVCEWDPLS